MREAGNHPPGDAIEGAMKKSRKGDGYDWGPQMQMLAARHVHLLWVGGQNRTKGRLSKRRGTHPLWRKATRYQRLHLLKFQPLPGESTVVAPATNGGLHVGVDIRGSVAEAEETKSIEDSSLSKKDLRALQWIQRSMLTTFCNHVQIQNLFFTHQDVFVVIKCVRVSTWTHLLLVCKSLPYEGNILHISVSTPQLEITYHYCNMKTWIRQQILPLGGKI